MSNSSSPQPSTGDEVEEVIEEEVEEAVTNPEELWKVVHNKVLTITHEKAGEITNKIMQKKVKKVNRLLHKPKAFSKAVSKAIEQAKLNDLSDKIEAKVPSDSSTKDDIPLDIFPDSGSSLSTVTPPDPTTTNQSQQTNNDEGSSDDESTDTPPPLLLERGYMSSDDSNSENERNNDGPEFIRGGNTDAESKRKKSEKKVKKKKSKSGKEKKKSDKKKDKARKQHRRSEATSKDRPQPVQVLSKKSTPVQSRINSFTSMNNGDITIIASDEMPIEGISEISPNEYPNPALSGIIEAVSDNGNMKEEIREAQRQLSENDYTRLMLTVLYSKAVRLGWIQDTPENIKAVTSNLQFYNNERLTELFVNNKGDAKREMIQAISRVFLATSATLSPMGVQQLYSEELYDEALSDKRPAYLKICQLFLRRCSVFGEKNAMEKLLKVDTIKLKTLATGVGELAKWCTSYGFTILHDPPKIIQKEMFLLDIPMEKREAAIRSPNSVLQLDTAVVRNMGHSTRHTFLDEAFLPFLRTVLRGTVTTMMAKFTKLSLDGKFKCIFTDGFFIEQFRSQYRFLDTTQPATPGAQRQAQYNNSGISIAYTLPRPPQPTTNIPTQHQYHHQSTTILQQYHLFKQLQAVTIKQLLRASSNIISQ